MRSEPGWGVLVLSTHALSWRSLHGLSFVASRWGFPGTKTDGLSKGVKVNTIRPLELIRWLDGRE